MSPNFPTLQDFALNLAEVEIYGWHTDKKREIIKVAWRYCKDPNSSLSPLVAHPRIFRLFIKRKFDPHVLWPLAKKVKNCTVDQSTARDCTVCNIIRQLLLIHHFWKTGQPACSCQLVSWQVIQMWRIFNKLAHTKATESSLFWSY